MRYASLVALALTLSAVAPHQVFAQDPAAQAPATQPPAAQPAPSASTPSSSSSGSKAFIAVHFGGQAGSSSLRDVFTFTQYDETATVTTDQDYGGGVLFNIEGGYKFGARWAAGVAFTRTGGNADSNVTAVIPHPQIFDAPRTATFDTADTNHSERAAHFFLAYLFPVSDAFEMRVFAGPSVINVHHDLVAAVNFTETAPFTTVTINGTTNQESSKTVGAFHVGLGGTYAVTDRVGVDGFFRFARRTVDLPGVGSGTAEIKAGGAQFGVGLRVGF
jgi:opacity protein-like surface antigen